MRIMALSLQEKIEDTNQGVYLIGTTPPKIGTDKAQLKIIAEKLLASELREKAMSQFRESIAQKHFISPVHWVAERRLKTETVQE